MTRVEQDGRDVRMHQYSVFGGVLRTEVEFPELAGAARTGTDRPDWTLRLGRGAPPAATELLGERRLGPERYRLWKTSAGLRLEYSHAGCYDISPDGADIVWYADPSAPPELGRWIVLGSVLALVLEAAGNLCLHGSAVALGDGAVAFLAPKHHGKSTLATALTSAGAPIIGDDNLAVRLGSTPALLPGVASVRLWQDAASRLHTPELCSTVIAGTKTTITGFAEERIPRAPVPLAAIYLLRPVPANEGGPAASRIRLTGAAAGVALAHQTKLPDSLIGYRAAGVQLRAVAAVAATVPVYTLHLVRDFGRLAEAVEDLMGWHASACAGVGLTGS